MDELEEEYLINLMSFSEIRKIRFVPKFENNISYLQGEDPIFKWNVCLFNGPLNNNKINDIKSYILLNHNINNLKNNVIIFYETMDNSGNIVSLLKEFDKLIEEIQPHILIVSQNGNEHFLRRTSDFSFLSTFDIENINFNNKKEDPENIIKDLIKLCCRFNEIDENSLEYSFIDEHEKKIIGNIQKFNIKEENEIKLNVLIIGNTGVGKSTFINEILQEKKTITRSSGNPVTTKIANYSHSTYKIYFYDTPGIENENEIKNVKNLLIKKQNYFININDGFHLIFYLFNPLEKKNFNENQTNFLKYIKSLRKLIYFILTHSGKIDNKQKTKDQLRNYLDDKIGTDQYLIKNEFIKENIGEYNNNEKIKLSDKIFNIDSIDEKYKFSEYYHLFEDIFNFFKNYRINIVLFDEVYNLQHGKEDLINGMDLILKSSFFFKDIKNIKIKEGQSEETFYKYLNLSKIFNNAIDGIENIKEYYGEKMNEMEND